MNHLNFQEIFWIFTIGSIISLIVEIPTGIFADLYGKRKSIIISKFGIFCSYVLFGLSNNFWMFLLSQVVFELGNSFRTGTETAYTYDYLKQNPKNPNYTEVKGKQKFWARVSESGAALIGGFLAKLLGYNWVFLIAAIPAFLNFLLAVSWEEIKERKSKKLKIKESWKHAKESMCELCKKSNLFKITINIMLFAAIIAALQKFIQPYMVDASLPVEWFGVIYSVALGITAIVVRYSHVIEKKFGTVNTINYMSFLGILPLLVLGLGHVSLIGVGLFFFVIIIENI
jgi:MFS family permease